MQANHYLFVAEDSAGRSILEKWIAATSYAVAREIAWNEIKRADMEDYVASIECIEVKPV